VPRPRSSSDLRLARRPESVCPALEPNLFRFACSRLSATVHPIKPNSTESEADPEEGRKANWPSFSGLRPGPLDASARDPAFRRLAFASILHPLGPCGPPRPLRALPFADRQRHCRDDGPRDGSEAQWPTRSFAGKATPGGTNHCHRAPRAK